MTKQEQLIEKQRELISVYAAYSDYGNRYTRELESEISKLEAEIAKEKDVECKHLIFTTHTGDYCYCLDCESAFLSPISFPIQQEKDKCIIANHNFISKDGYLCCTKCKIKVKQESYSEYFARTISSSRHQENDRKDEPKMSAGEILKQFRVFFNKRYDKCEEAWKIEILNVDIRDFVEQFKQ
jgi:ribosomal protein L37AE/L43A